MRPHVGDKEEEEDKKEEVDWYSDIIGEPAGLAEEVPMWAVFVIMLIIVFM